MITKAAILFLVGTTLTSAQFFPHMYMPLKYNGCPPGPELAPIICKFMQPNIAPEFKPQLIAPTTYIAPLIVEKCDKPQLQDMELPAPLEDFKPVVIPEAPELPPMTIPKFPVPIIFEEPAPLPEPCESTDIHVMPVNIPAAPELSTWELHELPKTEVRPEPYLNEEVLPEIHLNTIEYEPISVPQPPELPAFVMPELPTIEAVQPELPMPAAPCLEDEPIPAPIPAYFEPLAPVPAAPELPAFVMPELPTIEAVQPELPMPAAPCLEDEPIPAPIPAYFEPLAPVPAAPELPAFVMPELPTIETVQPELPMPAAPCLEDEAIPALIPAYFEPLAPVPAAPELPAFVMPELPTIEAVQPELPMPAAPCLEDEPIPAPIPAYFEPLAPVPAAPELPAFVMPELPTIEAVQPELPMPAAPYQEDEPIPIPAYFEPLAPVPAAPELPAFVMPELPTIESVQPELPMPAAPCLEDQPIPALIPAYFEPLAPVPAAPELPAFVMSELPTIEAVQPEIPMPSAPYQEDEPIPAPKPAYVEPLAPVPAAPQLPAFIMPELPTPIVEQELPIRVPYEPTPFIPFPALRQQFPEYNMVDYEPIPHAPELPAFVLPEMPVYMPESPAPAEPCLEDLPAPIVAVPEYIQPLAPVPAAPELPLASLPELPLRVEVPSSPVMIAPEPGLTEEKPAEPIFIPQPPALPEIKMPELPVRVAEEPTPCGPAIMPNPFYQKLFPNLITIYDERAKETQNIFLPSRPIESTPCVYNLVMKHVMPNMLSNNFRLMENIEIKPASFSPCS